MPSTLEATAPCRLELIGGPPEDVGRGSGHEVLRLAVALDRRVWCRIEPRQEGIEIHSKDTGERLVGEDARDMASGPGALVARALLAAGVRSRVRVATQVRVPEDAGLGSNGALEVAVLAAAGQSVAGILGRQLSPDRSGGELTLGDCHAAVFGGVQVLVRRGGQAVVERPVVDPARLEECLLLVDPGPEGSVLPQGARPAAAGLRIVEALRTGAFDEVAGLLAEVHAGRFDSASPGLRAIVEGIGDAGGAAWPSGRLVAVWAAPGARSPGPREAVASLLKAAGLRSFPARVDLRGLEVE